MLKKKTNPSPKSVKRLHVGVSTRYIGGLSKTFCSLTNCNSMREYFEIKVKNIYKISLRRSIIANSLPSLLENKKR